MPPDTTRGTTVNDVWVERRSEREGGNGASRDAAEATRGFSGTGADSQYQRDRARIIHGASFRSLQSKTQVLGLGESDFYRTRLTHSLEVAQIGSGICEWLRERSTLGPEERALVPSFSLIEAVCLAHDIGHAPFGHGGEVAMNAMMREHGGFEANAQTLRIVARLGEYSASCGLDLTRRTMLGTVKYPTLYSAVSCYPPGSTVGEDGSAPEERFAEDDPVPLNIDRWAPPKCLYDNERDVLEWLLEPFDEDDRRRFVELESPAGPAAAGHRRSRHKPFDASIMELADDIAYGVHDLEDMLALGLVERDAWEGEVSGIIRALPDNPVRAALDELDRDLFDGSTKARKHAVSRLVGYLIRSIDARRQGLFAHPLLDLQAFMEPLAHRILMMIKDFVMEHVIQRPELQMLQYKGQRVVVRLFSIFAASPKRLLPRPVFAAYEREGPRAIADYLSGMTDVSAGKLYHKLLSPTSGSIFDRP